MRLDLRSGTDTPRGTGVSDPGLVLRTQVRNGLIWSLANSLSSRLLTVVFGVVMARLLSPENYGTFTVALVTLTVLQSMNELGVSVAVVRWVGDVTRPARTAVTVSVAGSCLFYVACFLLAPWVAEALQAPPATGVIRVLAIGVVLDGISSIPAALMTRAFLQARRATVDVIGIVVSGVVSLSLAATGHGAISLAWGMLAGNAVATGMILLLAPQRPRPACDPKIARELIRFGMPLAGTSLLTLAILNVDFVVVGHNLGPAQLGFYLLAFNLSNWPSNLLSVAIRRVAIPGFSRLIGDDEALSRSAVRWIAVLIGIGGLCAVLLAILGEHIIPLVYGARWMPAAPALQFLAILCAVRIVTDLCYDILVSVGRPKALLAIQAVWFVTLIPALVVGTRMDGIRGAGIAHAVVSLGLVLPAYLLATHRAGPSLSGLAHMLARPVLVAADVLRLRVRGPRTRRGRVDTSVQGDPPGLAGIAGNAAGGG